MPELPEVEVICRGLKPYLLGRRIDAIFHNGKGLRHPVPLDSMRKLLTGKRVSEITRRAKYLLVHMDSGEMLIIHLGMTGKLGLFPIASPLSDHDHIRWHLDSGLELRFRDPRRFGSVRLVPAAESMDLEKTLFKETGPEPFNDACSPKYLQIKARQRKQPVKLFLMDGRILAGIGNIYANEGLFSAGISPERPVGSLCLSDWQRLLVKLREILNHAIDCGGSTISDFLNASGERGHFQVHFRVYGKKGAPCDQCGKPIHNIKLGGRSSFFCPQCQK
jgi:formamidopyrimidine-DNA glycosylase